VTVLHAGRANHWSAIIGASHTDGYALWEYGSYASEGVRQVAELGSPIKMEEEIRRKVGPPEPGVHLLRTVNNTVLFFFAFYG